MHPFSLNPNSRPSVSICYAFVHQFLVRKAYVVLTDLEMIENCPVPALRRAPWRKATSHRKASYWCIVESGVDWLLRVWGQTMVQSSSPHPGLEVESCAILRKGNPHDLSLRIGSSHCPLDTQTGLFVLSQLLRCCLSSVCSSLADASCTTVRTVVSVIKDPSVANTGAYDLLSV